MVRGVCLLGGPVQGARVGNTRRRTVAAKTAFGKELDLLVVGVAGDGAGGADAARGGTGEAEIDGLSDGPHGEGAAGELVGEGECCLAEEGILRSDEVVEGGR